MRSPLFPSGADVCACVGHYANRRLGGSHLRGSMGASGRPECGRGQHICRRLDRDLQGAHFAIGGSAGGSVYRYLIILVESGYSPLGNYTLANHQGLVSRSSGLYDFDLAFHVRIPIKHRWEPYGIGAPALLYNRFQKQVIQPNGVITYASGKSDVKFGFETGGGLRYYIHEDWGIRPKTGTSSALTTTTALC